MVGLAVRSARAEEVLVLEVTRESGDYRVHADAILQAPVARIQALLTDYAALGRLNPSIKSVERLPSPQPDVARVRTVVEACVFLFCRDLVRVEDVRAVGPGRLEATVLPEASDFAAGISLWRLLPMPDGSSRLVYQSRLRPDFWVPPLLGPSMIRHAIDRELRTTLHNLERLAAAPPETPEGHD